MQRIQQVDQISTSKINRQGGTSRPVKDTPALQLKCNDCEQEESTSPALQKAPDTTSAAGAGGADDTVAGMSKAAFFEMLEDTLCQDVNGI